MSHIRIDKAKATKKWAPVLENMGVTGDRVEWMAEYAEFHSINENAYVNAANVAGMGGVLAAQPGSFAGVTTGANAGSVGSGDVGQNLLPVAMKIAAQTIGLDLVAVKPSPGPKIDLLYIDFQYDDTREGADERPQVFKVSFAELAVAQATIRAFMANNNISEVTGGLQGGRIFIDKLDALRASPLGKRVIGVAGPRAPLSLGKGLWGGMGAFGAHPPLCTISRNLQIYLKDIFSFL